MMNHGKKLLSLLLAVMMLMGMLQTVAFAGVDVVDSDAIITLTPSTTEALKPGDTFTVSVDLAQNPGYISAAFCITYDKAALTATGFTVARGDSFSYGNSATSLEKDYGAFITFAASEADTYDGRLFSMSFKVNDDAQGGSYSIAIDNQNEAHLFDYQDPDVNTTFHTWGATYVPATVTVNAAVCEHADTTTAYAQIEGTETHTVTVTCASCGEQVGEVGTEACVDEDANGECDKCHGAVEVEEEEISGLTASIKGNQTVEINEIADVELFINSDNADEIYNAFKFEVSYDSSILTYSGNTFTNEAYNVSDNGEGKLIIDGYGDDIKVSGENALVTLKFTAKAGGEGKVEISKAAANDRGVAIESDVQPITVSSNSAATITVNAPKETYTVTFEGSGAGDANGESEVTEGDNYTFTVSMQPNYTYNITAIMGGVNYELNGGYTIENVNGNIVITVERTYNGGTEPGPGDPDDPNTYNVTLPEGVIGEQTATSGEDYTFTVPAGSDVPTVTINGQEIEIGDGVVNDDGSVTYTISGEQIVGAIVVTLPESEVEITVEIADYFQFDGGVMKLVVAQAELGENKVLTYEGKAMYWSEQYQGYAYLVPVTAGIEAFGAFTVDVAKANVAIADGSAAAIANDGDVNESGVIDINDAQLTYDIYKTVYSDFTSVSMEKMLRADVNNDRKVNVSDVTAVVDIVRQ